MSDAVTNIYTGRGKNDRVRVATRDEGILLRTKPGILLTPEQAMKVADALVDHAERMELNLPAPTTPNQP